MWSDNETEVDLLDIRHLIAAVATTVRNERLLPVTVGVFGDWGSGKSSVVRMVQKELAADRSVLCVSFNGWKFESYEDARSALMGSILDEIMARPRLGKRAKDLGRKLLGRVDWFRMAGLMAKGGMAYLAGDPTLATPDPGTLAATLPHRLEDLDPGQIKDLLKAAPEGEQNIRRTIRDFQKDFGELLRHSRISTLVVAIDDLDRCLPDTVIETLEAIRLFLFVERTAFIIGADEDLVRHAVRMRFPEAKGTQLDVGQNYLEKLIQVPIRIPPLGRAEAETYMNLLFAELHLGEERVREILGTLPERGPETIGEVGFTYEAVRDATGSEDPELAEDFALVSQIGDILTAGLNGNPRQVKRFLNALLLRMEMAKARRVVLRRRVLAKLMLLEYFKPESFRMLAEWQAAHEGIALPLRALETRVTAEGGTSQREAVPAGDGVAKPADERTAAVPLPPVPSGAEAWLEPGSWLRRWLELDPLLGDEDLRPYFFFARDRVGPWTGPVQRLSPAAKRVMTDLVSGSLVARKAAAETAKTLSAGEASGIFEILTDRVRRTEDLGGKESPLSVLMELASVRRELVGEVVSLLRSLPEVRLGAGLPPQVLNLAENTEAEPAAKELLQRWANSKTNSNLAAAAAITLKPTRKVRPAEPPIGRQP